MSDLVDSARVLVALAKGEIRMTPDEWTAEENRFRTLLEACNTPDEIEEALKQDPQFVRLSPDLARLAWEKLFNMGVHTISVLLGYATHLAAFGETEEEDMLRLALIAEAERLKKNQGAQSDHESETE